MIVSIAELRAALGLIDSITAGDLALLNLLQPRGQSAVIDALGYDPELRRTVEYYPRDETVAINSVAAGEYDIVGGRAVLINPSATEYLQLLRLPVGTVHSVRVDNDGRFGQRTGAFAAETEWTAGTDLYMESEQDGLCKSGCLISSTGWPVIPGSIRVDYTAGYSADEFSGRAASGVNASGIHDAIMMTTVTSWHQYKLKQRQARIGFVPGPVVSERLGDYSYSLDSGSAAMMAAMEISVPAAAARKLQKFVHYGAMLT